MPFYKMSVERCSRGLSFQASFFAAMAEDLVIEEAEVLEFAGESRFSVIEATVDDDAESQPPRQVQEEDVLFSLYDSLHVFTVGHCPRVVLDIGFDAESFFEKFGERLFFEIEDAVTVARHGVDPSRYVYADGQNFGTGDGQHMDEPEDDLAQNI